MSIQTDDFAPAPRMVSAAPASSQEEALERALRPKLLDEYVGQEKVREQLEIFIGAARKRALLHHFGSARAVGAATLEDIKSVPGISGALAQKIHDHFRGGR